MDIYIYVFLILMSYLYGSIPFALVVGKVFYHTDVRESGSGNLGGSNTGRVLGKKAGLSVIILDASKCCISILMTNAIANHIGLNPDIIYLSALACIVGHCYPVFAGFRGGKAVSVAIGYILVTNIYAFFIALATFLIILKLFKYVSLASIVTALTVLVVTPFVGYSTVGMITNACIVALLLYKHKDNISRLYHHTETKITWM